MLMCLTPIEKLCHFVPLVPISVHMNLDRLVTAMGTRLFDITLPNILVLILLISQVHLVHSQDVQWPIHAVCNSERLTITYRSCGEINISTSKCSLFLSCFDEKYQRHSCERFFKCCCISVTSVIIFMLFFISKNVHSNISYRHTVHID